MKGWKSLFSIAIVLGCLFHRTPAQAQVAGFITDQNPGFANQSGAVYGYYHIEHATHGNFATKTLKELGSKEAQTGMIFICTALDYDAVDCTSAAQAVKQGGKVYETLATSNAPQDISPGIIPPKGYDVCQVIIDLYSITGASTFNAAIHNFDDANTKDSQGNLAGPFYIGMYISVPKTSKGEWARARFAVQFVPLGDRVKDHCLPVDLKMLLSKGPDNIWYDDPGRHWASQ